MLALLLSGCADYVLVHPTATPDVPVQSLPPLGYNHRYGNNPVAAADGLATERALFAQGVFWEVGVRADPQIAGFVDRSDAAAVARARAQTTSLLVSIATERLTTIVGMLAMPSDAEQEAYCVALLQHFRDLGYSHLTKASVLVFFTEQDEHAVLTWTSRDGYKYTVNDGDLKGNSIANTASATPLPAPPH
ncbi:MAG: hypothetical protein ACYDAC_10615 [Candidatus Dormibacteria bacterium]